MVGVEPITATKREAREKYREYRQALADHPLPYVKELKDAYNQLRRGHGIIDVFKAFKNAGLNADGDPRLAFWIAGETKCHFEKIWNGGGKFDIGSRRWHRGTTEILRLPAETYPDWPIEIVTWRGGHQERRRKRERISCPVPIVPPLLLPRGELSNYFILWEVEKWDANPPHDPLLLKRVSNNLFAIVAQWDLTELERAVVAGRVR